MKKRFLSLLTALIFVLTFVPIAVSASTIDSGTCGDLYYEINDDNTVSITDCNQNAASVAIPGEIDGLPVTIIGRYAFQDCTSLTSIDIPNSITKIESDAFYGCASLTSINVNENNMTYSDIDGVLFKKDKTELTCYPAGKSNNSYTIPNSVTRIGNDAFWKCKSLTSINIPNSVTSIGHSGFYGCASLTSIDIPNSVTYIGDYSFGWCSSLTSIDIPNSVTNIGYHTFYKTAYYNNENNWKNGVLYIDNALIEAQPERVLNNYKIKNGTTVIANKAFDDCASLTSLNIPNGVTSIGEFAFQHCNSLTNINIPNSVTSIDIGAFYSCESLTDVYYSGSEAEWEAIEIVFGNESLTNATVHYNSYTPDNTPDKPDVLETHSKSEILEKLIALNFSDNINPYSVAPSTTAPYATGKLNSTFLKEGLDYLNFIRYLAYLPDVQMTDKENDFAQHGAVLVAASEFGHFPPQPDDMDDDFYKIALNATSSSNLGWGHPNLQDAVQGSMDDASFDNAVSVGHRRWLLNPKLLNVGFGFVKTDKTYSAISVFDESRTEDVEYDYISWPSKGDFPNNVFSFDMPWSVTLNPQKYAKPDIDKVVVKLMRKSDGKEWTVSNTASPNDMYFNVNNGYYGIPNCIIFWPIEPGTTEFEGECDVTISGIYDLEGNETSLSYSVNFFSPTVTVTANASNGGTISPSGNVKILYGSDKTFKITPLAGYKIKDVKVNGKSQGAISEYTVQDVKEDMTIEATFKTASLNPGGSGGSSSSGSWDGNNSINQGGILYPSSEPTSAASKPTTTTAAQYENPFSDISTSDWFYDNIEYVYKTGLMNGTSSNSFDPNDNSTRGMIATILYRMSGKSYSNSNSGFADVNINEYYAIPVAWAQTNGIVHGIGDNLFSPDGNVTRQDFAVMLYRFAEYENKVTNISSNNTAKFNDSDNISDYAVNAMEWCIENGLIQGNNFGMLTPNANASRAEIAAIIQRYKTNL